MFFLQQNWRTRGRDRLCPEAGSDGEIMYTHVNKCKNDKIKKYINIYNIIYIN
jgi:hypothetical protein